MKQSEIDQFGSFQMILSKDVNRELLKILYKISTLYLL